MSLLKKYQQEAKSFSTIVDKDSDGEDIDHKGRTMSNENKKVDLSNDKLRSGKGTIDNAELDADDNYGNSVDNIVEGGTATDEGGNVPTEDSGFDESDFDEGESLLGDDPEELDDEEDDGPAGREPEIWEDPGHGDKKPEEGGSYGDSPEDVWTDM